ncbi:thermonuclease family protein [Tabrizicola sp.]|uniref:thermonuclease family protein n=1 Tax=Tabrizicola sp. TaxID=2005166 RepID=UPI003D26C897
MRNAVFMVAVIAGLVGPAFAHSGGLNKDGCHAGSKPYHCHGAKMPSKPKTSEKSKPKSTTAKTVSGVLESVRDGDTFTVSGVTIRLAAIDCPEKNTSQGKAASRFLKQYIGSQVTCSLTGAKTYDRMVGYCKMNGSDMGRLLIANTTCRVWEKYDVWNRY